MEQKALLEQIEQLKAELQQVRKDNFSQEKKEKELSEDLDAEKSENQTLWDQVEYLTREVTKHKDGLKQYANEVQKEVAKCLKEETLKNKYARELEEVKKQLDHHKSQEELLLKKEEQAKNELEALRASFQDIQEKYQSYLLAEKPRNEKLQLQLDFQRTVQRLKAEQDAFKLEMEQKVKLLQQNASERETSFHREMEDLRFQFDERMITVVEEQVSRALQSQTPHLDEQKDVERTRQVKEESAPTLQAPELQEGSSVCEDGAPKKKKKKSFWKRVCQFFGLKKKKKEKRQESTSI